MTNDAAYLLHKTQSQMSDEEKAGLGSHVLSNAMLHQMNNWLIDFERSPLKEFFKNEDCPHHHPVREKNGEIHCGDCLLLIRHVKKGDTCE